jgi:hypothetical protein
VINKISFELSYCHTCEKHQLGAVKSPSRKIEDKFLTSTDCDILLVSFSYLLAIVRGYQRDRSIARTVFRRPNFPCRIAGVLDYAIRFIALLLLLLGTRQPTVTLRYCLRAIPEQSLGNGFALFETAMFGGLFGEPASLESSTNTERSESQMALDYPPLLHCKSYQHGPSTTSSWAASSRRQYSAISLESLCDIPPYRVLAKPWTKATDDNDLVSHLVSLYFPWDHPCAQFVDQGIFLEHMRRGDLDSEFCSPLLVNNLLSMAGVCSPSCYSTHS